MPGSCCAKQIGKIIAVADFKVGIVGLDKMFKELIDSGITDKDKMKDEFLKLAREYGNFIFQNDERLYKDALLREFNKYCKRQKINF
jgi:hypothetical protein